MSAEESSDAVHRWHDECGAHDAPLTAKRCPFSVAMGVLGILQDGTRG